MKTAHFIKITLAAVVAFGFALTLTPGAVLAQDKLSEEFRVQSLEIRYKQAELVVQMFQLRIDMANLTAAKAQTLIDKASSEGKDTTTLANALAILRSQLDAAQSAHDSAAATLDWHAGFDDSGTVTDLDTARATLKSVRETLYDGRANLREGAREFRRAFREWRRANKSDAQSTTP